MLAASTYFDGCLSRSSLVGGLGETISRSGVVVSALGMAIDFCARTIVSASGETINRSGILVSALGEALNLGAQLRLIGTIHGPRGPFNSQVELERLRTQSPRLAQRAEQAHAEQRQPAAHGSSKVTDIQAQRDVFALQHGRASSASTSIYCVKRKG